MKTRALLLENCEAAGIQRLAKILHFFGVDCCSLPMEQLLVDYRGLKDRDPESSHKSRILCSLETLSHLIGQIEKDPKTIECWQANTHSVFAYVGNEPQLVERFVRMVTGDNAVTVDEAKCEAKIFSVARDATGSFGVMAGISGTASGMDRSYVLRHSRASLNDIVSTDEGTILARLIYRNVPVFLSTSSSIVDIDQSLPNGVFDIRDYVWTALPVIMYVKWAFAGSCWESASTSACVIIDDPLLRPNHGCVNFRELLALMQQHGFSTNIAFIPWNWRRSSGETIQLFRENTDRYSVSVHGCDHNRAEFGSSNEEDLYARAREAVQRMESHRAYTGLGYDPVMVFPQGVFSRTAVNGLRQSGFIAAVNNDTIAVDSGTDSISIREFWNVAVMNYGSFPIFTRRYPWEGIENFAFDIMVGKPAIIVIHHEYCNDRCAALVKFIKDLNALECTLNWRSVSEVVRHSFRQRELSPDAIAVEMYGMELRLQNCSDKRRCYFVSKREAEPSQIDEVRSQSARLEWNYTDGCIRFKIQLDPGGKETVSVRFRKSPLNGRRNGSLYRKAGTALRRYLCEARDNYVVPTKFRLFNLVNDLKPRSANR